MFKYRLEFNRYGVVINKRVHLLSGPGKNFQELGVLFEASEIAILKSSDDFYKVRFNRQIGWISQKDVEKVN